jgi:hypothetical protein
MNEQICHKILFILAIAAIVAINTSLAHEIDDQGGKIDPRDQGNTAVTGDQGNKPATGDQSNKPATGDQSNKPAAGDQGNKPATGDQGNKTVTGDQGGKTQSPAAQNWAGPEEPEIETGPGIQRGH